MPNEVLWATTINQRSFQTKLFEILTRPGSKQCFYSAN